MGLSITAQTSFCMVNLIKFFPVVVVYFRENGVRGVRVLNLLRTFR